MQKKRSTVLLVAVLLFAACLSARTLTPPQKSGLMMKKDKDERISMFTFYAGFAAGGKRNTCYFLKSRINIQDRFSIDGAMYRHFNGDILYNASLGFGGVIQLTTGIEFGDRTFFINRDTTLEHIRFKNQTTGEYAYYSQFPDFRMPQQITSYNLGVQFNIRFPQVNYWRGVGECWSIISFKWEAMYAPKIGYDNTLLITTQGPYQAETTTYELEDIKVRKWGFRMVMDSRLGSKIGWMMEFGIRPGIRSELNEEHRFANGYVRMGVVLGISVGGRSQLNKPGFGREVPEN